MFERTEEEAFRGSSLDVHVLEIQRKKDRLAKMRTPTKWDLMKADSGRA